jgi:hypothetical protein
MFVFNDNKSRERKARIYDGLAVTLLMALMMCLGVVVWAASAKADAESNAYAAHYAGAVCAVIAEYPSTSGLQGILNSVQGDGLSAYQAGEAVALSVYESCPRYAYILDLYVAKNGRSTVA